MHIPFRHFVEDPTSILNNQKKLQQKLVANHRERKRERMTMVGAPGWRWVANCGGQCSNGWRSMGRRWREGFLGILKYGREWYV
jgi:hypothetical protein